MSFRSARGNRASPGARRGLARLSPFALMYLRVENPAWPCHFGGLAVVEGEALLDESGKLRLQEIQDRLSWRLARVPELRRRVHVPGPLEGKPLWVDDQRFAIEHHVHETAVRSPGGDAQLLGAAARVYEGLLNRRRPLWELWFLTGLSDGRVGVLLKLHHAVADGMAAVAIMGSLFDIEPDAHDPLPAPWRPEPVPWRGSLLADNLSTKARTLGRGAATLAHPARLMSGARVIALVVRRSLGHQGAPRTSLNRPVRVGRRIGFLRLDLAAMKQAAHAHDGKLNDVVLDLWAGGLRRLLVSRGEPIAGVELTASQAVSLRSCAEPGTVDNQVGTIVLPLPVWEPDAQRRLDLLVDTTRTTKTRQRPAAIMNAVVGVSATPIGRYFTLHQRACNVLVTNVPGPPVPMYILGARILDVLPIIELVGNIGLTLCAFSYAGQISLVVTADADAFPDLNVLMAGMERDWYALIGARTDETTPAFAGTYAEGKEGSCV